jgi:hypothetical protein
MREKVTLLIEVDVYRAVLVFLIMCVVVRALFVDFSVPLGIVIFNERVAACTVRQTCKGRVIP